MPEHNQRPFATPVSLNVLTSAWVPVRMPDGSFTKLSPKEIASSAALEVAHPRPDFSALITEILVCLYQTLAAPATEVERVRLRNPGALPGLEGFDSATAKFELLGEGVRFLQSPIPFGKEAPTSGLLFEAPGNKTREQNKDFYVGRDAFQTICTHCAPALLMLNQAHARVGGSGYCTALRGGSAMTALILGKTLWDTVRLNLLSTEVFLQNYSFDGSSALTLPWESRALFTDIVVSTDELGAYVSLWWTPQALRLTSRPNLKAEPCTLCGEVHSHVLGETVHKAATRAKAPAGLYHPHTAWLEKKGEADFLPVLTPKAGNLLREWVGLNLGGGKPGTSLAALNGLGVAATRDLRLWTFGPGCDKNTMARWHDEVVSTLIHSELSQAELREVARSLLETSQKVISFLGSALHQNKSSKLSVPLKSSATQALAALTITCREQMGATLPLVDVNSGSLALTVVEAFNSALRSSAEKLFDEYVQFDGADPKRLEYALKVRAKLHKQLRPAPPKSPKSSVSK